MTPPGDDEPYKTWPEHPHPEVEQIFLQANRDGFVIYIHGGIYTLVAPDVSKDYQFLGRVVSSTGIWRHMVSGLRDWIDDAKRQAEGQG